MGLYLTRQPVQAQVHRRCTRTSNTCPSEELNAGDLWKIINEASPTRVAWAACSRSRLQLPRERRIAYEAIRPGRPHSLQPQPRHQPGALLQGRVDVSRPAALARRRSLGRRSRVSKQRDPRRKEDNTSCARAGNSNQVPLRLVEIGERSVIRGGSPFRRLRAQAHLRRPPRDPGQCARGRH